jgi:4-amino-4-deoxy-L-arabinose transferase-like glycosyltransferase
MSISPGTATRRRWLWRLAVTIVVAYAAWLRLILLFDKYGPFDHPGWVVALERATEAPRAWLAPATWREVKIDTPYVGGDPITYLEQAKVMRGFYQATVREPLFLEVTRFFLKHTQQDVGISFASLSFSVLCVLGTYLLGAAAFSRGVGLAAALALAVEREFATWAPDGWRDETFAAFVLLTAWALLRLHRERTWRWAATTGVFAAGACLTRITALTFVVPALAWAAWPWSKAGWTSRGRFVAAAAGVWLLLVAPYVINCAVVTGDPLIAVDYHTTFYLAADNESTATRPTAMRYIVDRIHRRPVREIDTAIRGLVEYPFAIKWRGFVGWHADWIGPALRALAFAGLLIWIWQPVGRFLLLVLLTSLAPYMLTWSLRGGGEWRFTMHAYPFYLLAACSAAALAIAEARASTAGPAATLRRWRAARVPSKVLATVLLVSVGGIASYWAPYLIAREGLLAGESTSVEAGDRDAVFFSGPWTGLVHAGAVVSRFALDPRATIFVPLPERRSYHLVLRIDPMPKADAPPLPVRVLVNGREVATFGLTWNAERIGAYETDLPADVAGHGRTRIDLIADHASPIGDAAASFPELAGVGQAAFRFWYVRLTPR